MWVTAVPPLEAVRTTSLPRTLCEFAQTPPLPPQHLKINSSSFLAFSTAQPSLVKLRQATRSLKSRALTVFLFSLPRCLICPLPNTNGFLNETRTIDGISQLNPNTLYPPFPQPLSSKVRCEQRPTEASLPNSLPPTLSACRCRPHHPLDLLRDAGVTSRCQLE